MFTIGEFTKIFKDEEDKSTLVTALLSVFTSSGNASDWTELFNTGSSNNYDQKAMKEIFADWEKKCEEVKKGDKARIREYIEMCCLLENIFRNVILRPYVPAYRIINMDSIRHRFSKTNHFKKLLKNLGFIEDNTLFIYQERDYRKTILYAYICAAFCHYLSLD